MAHRADEETPLLHQTAKKTPTPLPWFQLSILLFLQLAEPLTSQVIHPFAPDLVRSLGITGGNEKKVGYYVGMLQSVFFFTQAFTVLQWSRISDRVGRKPVILTGLAGLSISMYSFGLSTVFWGFLLSRSLCGALNGNVGVIKSTMADLTDSTNIARAYTYIPIAWSIGGAVAPIIGGMLSRPAEQFPGLFGNNQFLKKYPYFLPCAVSASFSATAWLVAFIFLKETVKWPMPISQCLGVRKDKLGSRVRSPSIHRTDSKQQEVSEDEKPLPLRALLVPKVVIAASNYALMSLVDIAFRAIQPVFYSSPIEDGGLGLSPAEIGKIFSIFGILNGVFQLFFASIHDRCGSRKTFIVGMAATLPMLGSFPVINILARAQGCSAAVWSLVGFQVAVSVLTGLSRGAIFIFINNSSPNRASIGATNGLSQMSVSITRAIGPALANALFSLSIDKGYLGGNLVYFVLMSLACVSLYVASLLPRNVGKV
ncbi:hypothetical protein AMATHDRAFT_59741 [Amanita thiersii Skay4041]|uniref:Major facilitator superfamily (MFS) profile domain-containing protein n=1 Tax=Amanita thiersii Skay4041 TaxID=703135 RepID=A0A2A9NTS8_9AGAR|nr:hypothetical protein AMATHDRAFT_59741 [Amanita thiersii Skay4041]